MAKFKFLEMGRWQQLAKSQEKRVCGRVMEHKRSVWTCVACVCELGTVRFCRTFVGVGRLGSLRLQNPTGTKHLGVASVGTESMHLEGQNCLQLGS